jgi:N-acetylmuramoyl-L-alanine amidase
MPVIAWLLLLNFNFLYANENLVPVRQHCRTGCKSMETLGAEVIHLPHSYTPTYRIKTIVLDAGHGGKDPGCIGATMREKENTLAIVLLLGAMIEEHFPDIKVIYTRETDVFIELDERAAIANRNKADLFISVHCNSVGSAAINGAETYVLGLHRMQDNLEVAKRENASIYYEENYQKRYGDYNPDSPEAHIISSFWQSAYLEQSILMAQYVQQYAVIEADRQDMGVKQAGFLVLRETAMPSVLVEAGYLTNKAEEAFLASDEGRQQMAAAIFKAVKAYKLHLEDGVSSVVEKKPKTVQPPAAKAQPKAAQKPQPAPVAVKKTDPPVNQAPESTTGYRIQLISWPKKLDINSGKLSQFGSVKEEFKDGKYYYFTGHFKSREEAEGVLPEIKNLGFKTAVIARK